MPAKTSPLTAYYRTKALNMIRDAKDKQEMPFAYRDLAERLHEYGVQIDHQVLINRINRGSFSITFALQVLAALGETSIKIPQPPEELKRKVARR